MIKRSIDLSFLIIGFTLLMPILLIVILVVVIFLFFEDGYPIFYTQDRYAKNKKKFKLFKFRSMIKNAEQQTGAIWASKEDDPRLTKTGKFIRKYAIDEIPQLINILRGDISIVGPRPERPELYKKFLKGNLPYEKRLNAPQGLTGLAQLLGSYDTLPKNKLRYDLLYIKNQSLCLDMKIIFFSVLVTIIGNWQTDSRQWVKKFF
jgi:lipopolysaccharide/colanic/teichoic acid biosynthesis glycosyltransferase|tara:strand:+ start:4436 stop:5050 length:615 start_codon:yes stop_codon:yes gene_type:complete